MSEAAFDYARTCGRGIDNMKIRNTIIITDAGSELNMTLAEQAGFTGNVIFERNKLPKSIADELDEISTIVLRRRAQKEEK